MGSCATATPLFQPTNSRRYASIGANNKERAESVGGVVKAADILSDELTILICDARTARDVGEKVNS
jgi:hypothetical protein